MGIIVQTLSNYYNFYSLSEQIPPMLGASGAIMGVLVAYGLFFPENKLISFFFKREKRCFYLYGNVGVGKTMIAHYVYDQLNIKKMKVDGIKNKLIPTGLGDMTNEFLLSHFDKMMMRNNYYKLILLFLPPPYDR